MNLRSIICAGCLPLLLVCSAPLIAAQAEEPAVDPKALAIFKNMADYLSGAALFSYHADASYDVLQSSGAKVEFGASRNTLIARPDRLYSEVQRRDGLRAVVVFDGKAIWAFEPDENVYATAPQPGDLDESIPYAISELHITSPLSDMLASDFYEQVSGKLTAARDLGETVLGDTVCDHLLMSNDYADFQMWISTGKQPLLQRIVITYREEPGQPQFRAQFLDWDMAPRKTGSKLKFDPPRDAQRIRFYVPDVDKGLEREDAS